MSAGFGQTSLLNAGFGATVVIGSYESDASATVSGNVQTTGDLTVEANSENQDNVTRGFASVVDPTRDSDFLQAVEAFLADVSLTRDIGDTTIDPNGRNGPDISLAGAVLIVDNENKASALVDDGAFVTAGGDLNIDAEATDNVQISATGSAGDAEVAAIGGAVAWSRLANQGTGFVGPGAVVDVSGELLITSNATLPNKFPVLDSEETLPQGGAVFVPRLT